MRKFILFLLVPFLMVMSAFAGEMIYDTKSDYEYDDLVFEFTQTDDEAFQFEILNGTGDTVYIDFEQSFICDYIDGTTELDKDSAEYLFDIEDIEEEFDIIDNGDSLVSPYYELDEGEMIFIYVVIEVDGEPYYWGTAIGNPE